MSRIDTHFVRPLTEFYKTNPFGSGFGKRLEPYAADLSEEALQAVATRLIETGGRSFPNFNTCRSALQAQDTALKAPVSTAPRPWEKQAQDKLDWKARIAAVQLCRCRMGEMADSEGWLPALIEFAQDTGRLPNEREVHGVKAVAHRSEQGLDRARGTPFYKNLVKWRQAMLERAHKDVFGQISAEPPAVPEERGRMAPEWNDSPERQAWQDEIEAQKPRRESAQETLNRLAALKDEPLSMSSTLARKFQGA